jgi:hypothetical protein
MESVLCTNAPMHEMVDMSYELCMIFEPTVS